MAGATGGIGLLFPGKFQREVERQTEADCDAAAASGISCEWDMNLRPSWTVGGHVAALWGEESHPRLRLDLAAQYVRTPLLRQDATLGDDTLAGRVWMQTLRALVLIGPEF